MKTFIVEMDEDIGCYFCEYEMFKEKINGFCKLSGSTHCVGNGDLNNRPEWCPLHEVRYLAEKKHDLDGKVWLEVEE